MDNVNIEQCNDMLWLKRRMDHVNEEQIKYFLDRTAFFWDGGMPTQQARAAALIELVDKMRL